jgi:hypothetical protein
MGLPRWMMLACLDPSATFTHGSRVGNSGATIVSTGARKPRSYPMLPTISS